MANSTALTQIEHVIGRLSHDERLWLIERLAHGLRSPTDARSSFAAALAEMAADPEMQRELEEIAQEFAPTETDGLEQP